MVRSLNRILVCVLACCVLVACLVFAAGAGAATPWWNLDSLSAPANLHGGVGSNEVQALTWQEGGWFVLRLQGGLEIGYFETAPYLFGLVEHATAANIQKALESPSASAYGYGPGNVTVTGGPAGIAPLEITSIGKDVHHSVVEIEPIGFYGSGSHRVVTPGRPDGEMLVSASNLGDGEIDGSSSKVTLRDVLPAGLVAVSATGKNANYPAFDRGVPTCSVVSASLVECTYEGSLPPYERMEAEIGVEVLAGAKSGEANEVSVSGGGAVGVSLKRPIVVSGEPTPFGPSNYEQTAFNEDGSLDTQAGSHPYALTTTLDLNRTGEAPYQPALPKDLHFDLPPGLVGNPQPFPQCTDAQFTAENSTMNECPADTALGVASVTIYEPHLPNPNKLGTVTVPVFNLKPAVGEPARFGFRIILANVILDTSVRTGGDYGVTVSVNNITQLSSFLANKVTFWGVPGDPIHDQSRGWECIDDGAWASSGAGPCHAAEQLKPPPFVSLPTSCTGALQTSVQADSWAQEGVFTAPLAPPFEPSLDGCNRLQFEPSVSVAPDGQAGSSPSGLTVGVHVPQDSLLNPTGLAESNVKDTTVTLPAGVALNPSAADGLEACSEAQIALSQDTFPSCPEASKVGTVEIKSPLLPNALTGAVYLAAQAQNPFGSLVAMYIVAQDPISGTLIKVAGEAKLDPVSGQLVSTFDNTPQLPFEDLNLHFFGGSRAPLGTPALCGSYTTTASIGPWTGNEPATPSSTFDITSGPNGSPCQSPLGFKPTLTAGTTSVQAGGFTPLTTTVSREDGQQAIKSFQLHMPPGLSGLLNGVELCGEAQADAGTCGPNRPDRRNDRQRRFGRGPLQRDGWEGLHHRSHPPGRT